MKRIVLLAVAAALIAPAAASAHRIPESEARDIARSTTTCGTNTWRCWQVPAPSSFTARGEHSWTGLAYAYEQHHETGALRLCINHVRVEHRQAFHGLRDCG